MEGKPRYLGPLPTQPEYGDGQPQMSPRMLEAWNSVVTKGYLMHNPEQSHPDLFVTTGAGGFDKVFQARGYPQRQSDANASA
ncbi:hypothetical protein SBA3_2780037 [Candidatus Sulfopaludibacter sp. SbA3]|nr:hypothetical protein SBA3_2780037 [Candidatus Sulfopaludibacter sp. SbA3]